MPTMACLMARAAYSKTSAPHREGGADRRRAGLAELERRIRIARHEDLFHRDRVWPVPGHQVLHAREDDLQTRRQPAIRRADAAAGDMHGSPSVGVDDAEARDARSGIDAKNPGGTDNTP